MCRHGCVIFHPNGEDEPTVYENTGQVKNNLSVKYVDHVSSNDSKQDRFAIFSIIDALIFRILQWFPQMRNIFLSSDNAKCYSNNIVGPLSDIVGESHGLSMAMFIPIHNVQKTGGQ